MWLKPGEKINLYRSLKELIARVSGPEASERIDAPLKSFQQTRDEILEIASHRKDCAFLERLIGETCVYISVWNCISKNVSIGPGEVN